MEPCFAAFSTGMCTNSARVTLLEMENRKKHTCVTAPAGAPATPASHLVVGIAARSNEEVFDFGLLTWRPNGICTVHSMAWHSTAQHSVAAEAAAAAPRLHPWRIAQRSRISFKVKSHPC
jgi:hypothetical protein